MYNPLPLLSAELLRAKIGSGKRFFVRQTYLRGRETGIKAAFLFRGYETTEEDLARQHIKKIAHDGNAFLYDTQKGDDAKKLFIAARQPDGYRIYYAGRQTLEWKPPVQYQNKMKQFIMREHPGWRTKKGGDKIQIGLYEEFGTLFLKFSFEGEDDNVALETIEQL